MDHNKAKNQIEAYYDGELAPADRGVFEEHLAACAACRADLAAWRRAASTLCPPPEERPNEAFVTRVMARLPEGTPGGSPSGWSRWLTPALGFGFAGFLFFMSAAEFEAGVSAEALLLLNGRAGAASEWAFQPDQPDDDEVFGYVLEGL